jgi:hypothetical protein
MKELLSAFAPVRTESSITGRTYLASQGELTLAAFAGDRENSKCRPRRIQLPRRKGAGISWGLISVTDQHYV